MGVVKAEGNRVMSYTAPVNKLLTLGDTRQERPWRNYGTLGIEPEHAPELIRMIQDKDLHEADGDSPEVWAPVHAWRALGQLRAEAAVTPLLGLLHRIDDDDDDALTGDVHDVLGMIGPAALDQTAAYLAGAQHGTYALVAAAEALREIAQRHPETREAVVAALVRKLERFGEYDRDEALNAFLISDLVDLRVVEAAPLIERAFAADAVDTMVLGDWPQVAELLGVAWKPASQPAGPAEAQAPTKKRKRFRKKKP